MTTSSSSGWYARGGAFGPQPWRPKIEKEGGKVFKFISLDLQAPEGKAQPSMLLDLSILKEIQLKYS